MSQCGQIYGYLLEGHTLTPLEALVKFGCLALHSRAAELRDRGIQIKTEMVRVGRKRVGRYSLAVAPANKGAKNGTNGR